MNADVILIKPFKSATHVLRGAIQMNGASPLSLHQGDTAGLNKIFNS